MASALNRATRSIVLMSVRRKITILIAAMAFNLLTTLGLRQHHSLLDIGCGSLRIGRLLIPYLNRGKYFGLEPNEWLVDEGIRRELGQSFVEIKHPTFFFYRFTGRPLRRRKPHSISQLAQSIFSHCGLDLIKGWLSAISRSLAQDGALVATFLIGEEDCRANGLDLPRMCKLPAGYVGTRSRRRESAIRNSGLETSTPNVGSFCRPRI